MSHSWSCALGQRENHPNESVGLIAHILYDVSIGSCWCHRGDFLSLVQHRTPSHQVRFQAVLYTKINVVQIQNAKN